MWGMATDRTTPCPQCKKPSPWEGNSWRPFCSERCRTLDLGNWASGAYRIPGPPLPVEPEEAPTKPGVGEEEAK